MIRVPFYLLCLFGAGCSLLQPAEEYPVLPPQQVAQLQQRLQSLASVQDFYLSARVAVTASEGGWSGNLRWEQHPASYRMNFNTPTGQGALQLYGREDVVELTLADGRTEISDDAEALLYQQTRLDFPVKGLRYWVTGLPKPKQSVEKLTFDEAGRITEMRQAGWDITYPGFRNVNGLSLPRKIIMNNASLKIRLVIHRWEMPGKII